MDERHRPPNECREIGRVCFQEARTALRVCQDGCEAGESGATCRRECRGAHKVARTACRAEVWECAKSKRPPMDEECVAGCREEFAETREDLRICHGDCKADVRTAIAACREDLASDSQALRTCITEAQKEGRLCSQDCHDEFACASEFRECLSGCVIEE